MKLTLLEIAQDIANDLDSDEFNSINDTIESEQIAQIIKSTYYAMISGRNWPHTKQLVRLEAPTTLANPTHMTLDQDIKEMVSINYNKAKAGSTSKYYQPLRWVEPDDFLRVVNQRNSSNETVDVIVDPSGIELLISNNKAPDYYTSFNDETIVFDSYDSAVDSTLQSSKVQAQAYVIPQWITEDDFIPDLPAEAFTMLQEEAKSRAAIKLRQAPDQKAEQESVRQRRWLSQKSWQVKGGVQYPNYGRRSNKYHRDPTFKTGR